MVHDAARVKSIFLAALERYPAEQWPAYLDGACGEDAELRQRVERLLDAHGGQRSLHLPSPSQPEETVAQPHVERPGEMVGPYKLMEQIGEGGMGIVYVAEQHHPVRRKAALKIIKPGMDTRQVIARFEAERQALAMMDHPNIARVIDAGATASGRPYFVMELVRGIPITDYCDRERLTIPERLELFVLVCRAVQHAHQKGVIHRDLKPSNILVTVIDGAAVPKVIDFGVAKATGGQLTERTIYTAFQQFVGTPLYMSPEQAELSGVDVDTRSDIYALGVLLYELLTGTTPFDRETFGKAAFEELRRIIREQEPPKPSTRLSSLGASRATVTANRKADARHLDRVVRGELDWIVMKALEKDRRRRYETANDFAADILRHLADEPVQACPPSVWYRFRKSARRHRAALTTLAVVALALVAGTTLSVWQAYRARRAEGLARTRLAAERAARQEVDRLLRAVTRERNLANVARREADRRATEAREVVDFLINDLIGAASPSQAQGQIPTVDQVLARADQNIATRFADRPLIEASIRLTLGQAFDELGQYAKAEQHAARAVELRLLHLRPDDPEVIAAQNALAWALLRQGGEDKLEKARKLLTEILETARKSLEPEHPETLNTMHTLATALFYQGKVDEARALDEEVLSIQKRVLSPDDRATRATMNLLAVTWQVSGDLEKAKQIHEQVLAAQLRDQPNHPHTFLAMGNLAKLYGALGQHEHQWEMRRRILEGQVRVLGLTHPDVRRALESYFGAAVPWHARWDEARRTLESLRERSRRELAPDAELTTATTRRLVGILGMLGRTDEAVAVIDGLPEGRQALAARDELARYLHWAGHRDAALVQFRRVEDLRPRLVEADDPFGLEIRTRLALVLREGSRFDEARALLEQVAVEAPRLHAKLEQQRHHRTETIAQLLLRQWPGHAPGVDPTCWPPAPLTIAVPFRAPGPIADGRIDGGEYGPGVEVRFEKDVNPGRLMVGGRSRSKTPEDLSVRMHAAYTDRSLFLAFRVRDQVVVTTRDEEPSQNDSVDIFLDGDLVANDHSWLLSPYGPTGNREGFQLMADAGGHRATSAGPEPLTIADWKSATSRTPEGYIIEFEVPLALIDTRDGSEYVPATGGSEIRFNFAVADFDDTRSGEIDCGMLWSEDPEITPYFGGEDFWPVRLRLVPKSEPGGPLSRTSDTQAVRESGPLRPSEVFDRP